MKLEEVLPALREGKKVRRTCWAPGLFVKLNYNGTNIITEIGKECNLPSFHILADDWEIVPEPKRVADYLVPDFTSRWVSATGRWVRPSSPTTYFKQPYEVGSQPEGSVMVPGTEREEE